MSSCITDFFLTANTPVGLVSRFELLYKLDSSWRCHLIKGVPGNGKSTLLYQVAQKAAMEYTNVERIHCSGDPDSLDGVIVWDAHLLYLDATSPHLVNPILPQSNHCVISLYDTVDSEALWEERELIYTLNTRCDILRENARHLLSAAACLYEDTLQVAQEATDLHKVAVQASRICSKEFRRPKIHTGTQHFRFLSAMTHKGNVCFFSTAQALAERIYLLEDEYGASSRLLICAIRSRALSAGYDVINCSCAMRPNDEPEHLFIPELGIGFVTSNRFHQAPIQPYRIINSRRFTDPFAMKHHKKHLAFNKRTSSLLLEQSLEFTGEIAAIHKELEGIYGKAVDFSKVEQIGNLLVSKL